MSLFGNLFNAAADAGNKLFGASNAFASKAPTSAHTEEALDAAIDKLRADKSGTKRKRGAAAKGDTRADDSHKKSKLSGSKKKTREVSAGDADVAEDRSNKSHKKGKTARQRDLSDQREARPNDVYVPSSSTSAKGKTSSHAERTKPATGMQIGPAANSQPNEKEVAVEAAHGENAGKPQHDQDQLERTIYVGNVPATTKPGKLKAFFAGCGAVESVRLRNMPIDLESKMPKVHQIRAGKIASDRSSASAYVCFATKDAVPAALTMNMAVFDGHHLRVDRAAQPSKAGAGSVQYDPKRSVFVGNLPLTVQQEDVIQVFNAGDREPQLAGSVEAVRVVKDPKTSMGKGIAYVLFKTRIAAIAALNLNKAPCKGREMRVTRVKASAGGANATKLTGKAGKDAGAKGRLASKQGKQRDEVAGFQGTRTKGKGKISGVKGLSPASGVKKVSGASAAKRTGKRPAVAARKAKQLAAAGKLNAAQVKAETGKKKPIKRKQ